jgi:drug/metabolite transporter (DMT)-like permease
MSSRTRGVTAVAAAAVLFGLSGVAAQAMMSAHVVSAQWLVGVRCLASGAILVATLRPAFPWAHGQRLLLLSFIGVSGSQFTFFAAIAGANVATATFLQSTAIAMVVAFEIARYLVRPTMPLILAVSGAVVGIALISFGANGRVAGSTFGIVMALLSAVTLAFYILTSTHVVRNVGVRSTATWTLLLGATPFLVLAPPWTERPAGDFATALGLIAFIVVFGTIVPYALFFIGMRQISATDAGVTLGLEPVAAAIGGMIALGVTLAPTQYLGGILVVCANIGLSLSRRHKVVTDAVDSLLPRNST